MFAYYALQATSSSKRLKTLYTKHAYCLNVQHSFTFDGSSSLVKMGEIMRRFRGGICQFGGKQVLKCLDYNEGLNSLPKSNVLKFLLEDHCSLIVRPSGTELKLKFYSVVSVKNWGNADKLEKWIVRDLK